MINVTVCLKKYAHSLNLLTINELPNKKVTKRLRKGTLLLRGGSFALPDAICEYNSGWWIGFIGVTV